MGKTMQGGRRPGSGRPRQGEGLRRSVSFTLSPEVCSMVQELRRNYPGGRINRDFEFFIRFTFDAWLERKKVMLVKAEDREQMEKILEITEK